MKKKRSQQTADWIRNILFSLICLVLIINLLMPDRATSLAENRPLKQFPSYSSEKLLDGEYMNALSDWFSDQFAGRTGWIHFKYILEKMMGTKKIDTVYLGKEGLIEETSQENQEQMMRNLSAINNFCVNHGVRSSFLLVPNAVNVQKEQLPKHATVLDQNQQMDTIFNALDPSIQRIDVRKTLEEHKNEYLYYHSDHHWTSLAAFYSFQQLASSLKLGKIVKDAYEVYPVTQSFEGTLAKKTGSLGVKDTIDIYLGKNTPEYVVIDESSGTKSRSVYTIDGLESANPYDVFLGGNKSLIQIETLGDNDRHLLLFKDSYANALIPFLLPYYRTITIVDPRYFYEDIERIFRLNLITDVLFVYNSNTFVQDTSLADVIE